MSTWKIIFEVMLAIVSLIEASVFWSCVKSPKFLDMTLANRDEIKRLISFIGKDKIVKEEAGRGIPPAGLTYESLILLTTISSIKGTDRVRNIVGFVFLIILAGSIYLSWTFTIINLALFLIVGVSEISVTAKKQVLQDINSIMRYIYGWHLVEPDKCENFCLNEKPRYSLLYKTILSEII